MSIESSFILDARQTLREADWMIRAGHVPSTIEQELKTRLAELCRYASALERTVDTVDRTCEMCRWEQGLGAREPVVHTCGRYA